MKNKFSTWHLIHLINYRQKKNKYEKYNNPKTINSLYQQLVKIKLKELKRIYQSIKIFIYSHLKTKSL